MTDAYIDLITSFFRQQNITDFAFLHLKKHRAVHVRLAGRTAKVVFPATGSDRRGPQNCLRDIRHALGLVGTQQRALRECAPSSTPHSKSSQKRTVVRPPQPPKMVSEAACRPDHFYEPLRLLKARMLAAETQASECANPAPTSANANQRIELRTPWLGRRHRYLDMAA